MKEKARELRENKGKLLFCPMCGHSGAKKIGSTTSNESTLRCPVCGAMFSASEARQMLRLRDGAIELITPSEEAGLPGGLVIAELPWRPSPVAETLTHFDWRHQMVKLEEEVLELLAEIKETPHISDKAFVKECADVKNMIEAIDMTLNGAVTRAADTKMLRTQIRVRDIVKKRKEECERKQRS